jgi:hypothetical protein
MMVWDRVWTIGGISCALLGCSVEQAGLGVMTTHDDTTATPIGSSDDAPSDEDQGEDPQADPHEDPVDAALPPARDAASNTCSFAGLRALRIDATVSWKGSALLDLVPVVWPGSGVVSIIALVDIRSDDGASGSATIRACGAVVPPFISSLGEVYAMQFEDALWEAIGARWTVPVARSCATAGCAFSTGYVEPQLGVELPSQASWPGPREALPDSALRDDDGDGTDGVPIEAHDPGNAGANLKYAHPPADYLQFDRVSEVMLALRVGVELRGKLDSCTRYSGSSAMMSIDTRALGCRLDNGSACRADQTAFVNDNLPVWAVDRASWRMVDVSAGSGCREARAALH